MPKWAVLGVVVLLSVASADSSPPAAKPPGSSDAGRRPKGYVVSAKDAPRFRQSVAKQKFYTPSQREVDLLEKRMPAFLQSPAAKSLSPSDRLGKKLAFYGRQYVGLVDDQGGKQIWVNLIWLEALDNRPLSSPFEALDGRDLFCRVTFDLKAMQFVNLECNGSA